MFRSVFTIFARHHDFTAAELGAAEEKLTAGWTLDKGACVCEPAAAGGWQATLVLVGRSGSSIRVMSGVQADPTKARQEAMENLSEAVRNPQGRSEGAVRQTSLAAETPPPPSLRPSAIISLRDQVRRGDR